MNDATNAIPLSEDVAKHIANHFGLEVGVAVFAALEIAHKKWDEKSTRQYGSYTLDTLNRIVDPENLP